MKRRYVLAPVLLILSLARCFDAVQTQSFPASPRERVYFSALDKEEKPILGLPASQFELRINGQPAVLEGFRPAQLQPDRSIPLVLWILIDWSPDIQANMIKGQGGAAAKALDLFNPDSAFGVQIVSDRVETLEPLAHDPAGLRRAFAEFAQRRTEFRVGENGSSVKIGQAGMLGAADSAIDGIVSFCRTDPALKSREVYRAIMMISAGNVDPYYKKKPLYEKAAAEDVFLYPVFVPPSGPIGYWVEYYFDLAKRTGGVASVIGALSPGSKILPLPRSDTHANALTFNFLHMARDLDGKYSFEVKLSAAGGEVHLDLKARKKGVQIRLPRRILP